MSTYEDKHFINRDGLRYRQYLPTPTSTVGSPLFAKAEDGVALDDAPSLSSQSAAAEAAAAAAGGGDTQPFSQYSNLQCFVDGVENEADEGVWGYLLPVTANANANLPLVLRERHPHASLNGGIDDKDLGNCQTKNGYLVGRHSECDYILTDMDAKVSNRHFLLFREVKNSQVVALLIDLSTNGTYVNGQIVGKNNHRQLRDGDEISCVQHAKFLFRYPRTLVASTQFHNSYDVQDKLGSGAFASVHIAVNKHTGIKYAVKCFQKRPSNGTSFVDYSLRREIATLTSLDHPNVMRIKDAFDELDGIFLVLELAQGDLFDLVNQRSTLEEGYVRHLFGQVLSATQYLHERNIIHRDIKLENILLTDNGNTAKLADFGLAKIVGEESFVATRCGTPHYAAPEILSNESERGYTRAVDIWSLGVVLYICLSGYLPFSDDRYDSEEFPFRLPDQIKQGLVTYSMPPWECIDDTPLDLIDRMLTVDYQIRITVEGCLEHPWLTGQIPQPSEDGEGIYQALKEMDFSELEMKRKVALLRNRTFDMARMQNFWNDHAGS